MKRVFTARGIMEQARNRDLLKKINHPYKEKPRFEEKILPERKKFYLRRMVK
jgi:hypothetical protein